MTEWVLYCGRNVPKENFRTFVYSLDDQQKVVNSWDEYQDAISSGIWFPTKDFIVEEAPKKRKA